MDAFTERLLLPDPGPDGTLDTADDGPAIEVFQLRPDLVTQPRIVVRNGSHSASDFLTWEIVARRRFSGGWSLAGSFAHTWNRDHAREFFGQVVRANEFAVTPNDFINADPGGRHVYRNWTANLRGSWEGPWGVRIIPFLRHQSGPAFGRTLRASLNYGVVPVLAEPVGTRRQPNVTLLDVRMEKDIWRAGSWSLTPFLDVFNALNANPEQNLSWETGATFLRPLVIVPPRIARVGFRLEW